MDGGAPFDLNLRNEFLRSGQCGTMMPARMHLVVDSRAILDGLDLGRPVRLSEILRSAACPAGPGRPGHRWRDVGGS